MLVSNYNKNKQYYLEKSTKFFCYGGYVMDLVSLYYFSELAKDLNITKTSSRLFISQQTLSNHIMRMETECKAKLFYRKPKLMLTDAGREMLLFAKRVLTEKQHFENMLADIEGEQLGHIRFGASYLNSRTCLPIVLPQFAKEYPNVSIELTEFTSSRLQQLLINGELDMALTVINDNVPSLKTSLIMEDKVYLCISEKLLKKTYGKESRAKKEKALHGAYVEDFKELPFSIVSPPNILGVSISKCFEEANFSPKVYFSSTSVGLTSTICSNALSACFISHINLSNSMFTLAKDVNIFPLMYKGKPVYHKRYLVHNSRQYMTKYMLRFEELITECFSNLGAKDLTKVVK